MHQNTQVQQQKLTQTDAENVSVPDFLLKTYQMIEDGTYSSLVSWSKDGTTIIIKKPLAFSEEVLPVFFKHNNLSSFIRQLNNYSFRKLKSKEYEYCFYHEMFRKDRKDLLKHIRRKKAVRPKSQKSVSKQASAKKAAVGATSKAAVTPQEPTPDKKIHVEDGSSIRVFQENQIAYLRRTNQQLRNDLLKAESQDQSLRHVITVLTNYYGTENIRNVLKIAKLSEGQFSQDVKDESNKYEEIFRQPPLDNQILNLDLSNIEGSLAQDEQQQEAFVNYPNEANHKFGHSNDTYNEASVDATDHYSTSPHMVEEPRAEYENAMDLPIAEISTKIEPDLFLEGSNDQTYPYSTMNQPF